MKDHLLKNGIKCSEIRVDKEKEHKVMFIRDYDENLIELVEEL